MTTVLAYVLWVMAGERLLVFFLVSAGMRNLIDQQDDPERVSPLVSSSLLNMWNILTVVALILGGAVLWSA